MDEIADLPATQAKLLRGIEQRDHAGRGNEPVRRSRILPRPTALAAEGQAGRCRGDLFCRLNVVTLQLPPLRDRREDIPELVEFLLAKHVKALNKRIAGVSHEAMRILMACPWKGNVRELDNALQRAVILGDGPLVTPGDLPPDLAPILDDPSLVDDLTQAIKRFEKMHIERILRQTANKKEAAERLGIGLSSVSEDDELNVLVP